MKVSLRRTDSRRFVVIAVAILLVAILFVVGHVHDDDAHAPQTCAVCVLIVSLTVFVAAKVLRVAAQERITAFVPATNSTYDTHPSLRITRWRGPPRT